MVQWLRQRAIPKRVNNKGVTSLAEYAVTVFLVVATITAMTTYMQRTLQARTRDARHFMAKTVAEKCDVYCGQAAGLTKWIVNISDEQVNGQCGDLKNLECSQGSGLMEVQKMGEQYEPYYAQVNAQVTNDRQKDKKLVATSESAGTFIASEKSHTAMTSASSQATPSRARTEDDQALISKD